MLSSGVPSPQLMPTLKSPAVGFMMAGSVKVTSVPLIGTPTVPLRVGPAVTMGCSLSTVTALPDVVVALPAWSAAVTATWAVVVSILPAITV